jgi:hypothetical protein
MNKLKPPGKKILQSQSKNEALSKIAFFNFFIGSFGIEFENLHMSDDELYYVAMAAAEMSNIRLQRALFDAVHYQCDEDSVCRFLEHFPDTHREKIMISC